jgi:AraC-like DNA-binding protein/quercetin dioxygenase-like cupin family protein
MRALRVSSAHDPSSLRPVSRWRNLAPEGALIWASRSVYHPGDRYPLHGHDFHECTWIVRGAITLTEPGAAIPLRAGSVVFIHRDYRHGFTMPKDGICELINVVIPSVAVAAMAERYASWRWGAVSSPHIAQLDRAALDALDAWPEQIRQGNDDPLIRDAWLLEMQRHLRRQPAECGGLPDWLTDALAAASHPPYLAEGIPAVLRFSARSREHCSRLVRKHTGSTLRQLVVDQQLAFFEHALQTEKAPIATLAASCWGPDLSQLYRLFRERHGTSPAAWRRQQGADADS